MVQNGRPALCSGDRLRKELGREPTAKEIKVERDPLWRLKLGGMTLTNVLPDDETEE